MRQLFAIRIPLLLPIMAVAVLYGIVFTFTDMIVVFILTRGGPFDATQVLASWAYFKGVEGAIWPRARRSRSSSSRCWWGRGR